MLAKHFSSLSSFFKKSGKWKHHQLNSVILRKHHSTPCSFAEASFARKKFSLNQAAIHAFVSFLCDPKENGAVKSDKSWASMGLQARPDRSLMAYSMA